MNRASADWGPEWLQLGKTERDWEVARAHLYPLGGGRLGSSATGVLELVVALTMDL